MNRLNTRELGLVNRFINNDFIGISQPVATKMYIILKSDVSETAILAKDAIVKFTSQVMRLTPGQTTAWLELRSKSQKYNKTYSEKKLEKKQVLARSLIEDEPTTTFRKTSSKGTNQSDIDNVLVVNSVEYQAQRVIDEYDATVAKMKKEPMYNKENYLTRSPEYNISRIIIFLIKYGINNALDEFVKRIKETPPVLTRKQIEAQNLKNFSEYEINKAADKTGFVFTGDSPVFERPKIQMNIGGFGEFSIAEFRLGEMISNFLTRSLGPAVNMRPNNINDDINGDALNVVIGSVGVNMITEEFIEETIFSQIRPGVAKTNPTQVYKTLISKIINKISLII